MMAKLVLLAKSDVCTGVRRFVTNFCLLVESWWVQGVLFVAGVVVMLLE